MNVNKLKNYLKDLISILDDYPENNPTASDTFIFNIVEEDTNKEITITLYIKENDHDSKI